MPASTIGKYKVAIIAARSLSQITRLASGPALAGEWSPVDAERVPSGDKQEELASFWEELLKREGLLPKDD